MPKRKRSESVPQAQEQLAPTDESAVETEVAEPETNGHAAGQEPETVEATPEVQDPPAKVKYQVEGTPRAVQAAARKIANTQTPPAVATPANDIEPPIDHDALLQDGNNMVVVRRTFPKSVEMSDGSKRRCAVKLPDRYDCPTTREKIENDVFERFGGSEFKCTIHPLNSEGTILGYFTIENPSDAPPIFPDDPPQELPFDPRTDAHTSGGDRTMHETDQLAKLKESSERRVERARLRREAFEAEREAKRIEAELEAEMSGKTNPSTPPVAVESDELRKLREENEKLRREAESKKNDDRFAAMQNSIADLAKSVAALASAKPAVSEEASLVKTLMASQEKMFTQSQQHSKDMMTLMQQQNTPKASSSADDLDKFLSRAEKLQAITGGGSKERKLSSLEEKLIDMSFDRLASGGGGDGEDSVDDVEDAVKLAIKQFAPIAKTYVEKKMDQENAAAGGAPLPKEVVQKIYAEAAQAAAKKVQDDLAVQGLQLSQTTDGRLVALPAAKGSAKPVVPPRQPASRVVSTTKTSEGIVKKVALEPHDLSKKSTPPANAAPEEAPSEPPKGDDVKGGVFPMLGPNGTELKIPFPVRPGEMKYDRRNSVNFILDGIRSEILQGIPKKAQTDQRVDSYVVGDALEYLDDEILDQLDGVDSGARLEALLAPSGDAAKIAEIKKAGEDEVVASYLRRLVLAIQREWQNEKGKQ